jgi:hypothetical protein
LVDTDLAAVVTKVQPCPPSVEARSVTCRRNACK